jgi:hypothetical protein
MTLQGLKNDTKYEIRAVLIEKDEDGEFSDTVPVLFSSICLGSGKVMIYICQIHFLYDIFL